MAWDGELKGDCSGHPELLIKVRLIQSAAWRPRALTNARRIFGM